MNYLYSRIRGSFIAVSINKGINNGQCECEERTALFIHNSSVVSSRTVQYLTERKKAFFEVIFQSIRTFLFYFIFFNCFSEYVFDRLYDSSH